MSELAIANARRSRERLGIPDFVCAQPFNGDTGKLFALRFRMEEPKKDEPVRLQLEVQSSLAYLDRTSWNFEDTIVHALLDTGLDFEEVKNICNINRAANDIARETRRGAGNFLVIHESQERAFHEHLGYAAVLFKLRTVKTPEMYGKMIVTYKQYGDSQIDGGLLLAYNEHTREYALDMTRAPMYTRVMPFKFGMTSLELRRERKLNRDQV
jgi:hypothetical protein